MNSTAPGSTRVTQTLRVHGGGGEPVWASHGGMLNPFGETPASAHLGTHLWKALGVTWYQSTLILKFPLRCFIYLHLLSCLFRGDEPSRWLQRAPPTDE